MTDGRTLRKGINIVCRPWATVGVHYVQFLSITFVNIQIYYEIYPAFILLRMPITAVKVMYCDSFSGCGSSLDSLLSHNCMNIPSRLLSFLLHEGKIPADEIQSLESSLVYEEVY
jgi:hypothetical protein